MPSNNRLDADTTNRVLTFICDRYADFGPTLACEKLRECHDLILAKETVSRLMTKAWLRMPRRQRPPKAEPNEVLMRRDRSTIGSPRPHRHSRRHVGSPGTNAYPSSQPMLATIFRDNGFNQVIRRLLKRCVRLIPDGAFLYKLFRARPPLDGSYAPLR